MRVSQIFTNLCVKDLDKSMAFWKALGFEFNPKFTDQNAASLVLGENIFVMLLLSEFFKTFIPGKELADAATATEVITAISVANREEVDELLEKVIAAGGTEYREKQDYGWMYSRAFQDLDGHIWEPVFMDESQMPENPAESVPVSE